jgi:hypothetical protein
MAVNDLARRIRVDLTATTTTGLDGAWTQLKGIVDLNFPITPTKVDATSYDSNGGKDVDVTLNEFSGSVKCNRQSNAGVQDPGQLLLTGCVNKFAPNNYLYVRWYDKDGKPEPSFYGQAIVEQAQSKTGVADLDEDQFTFTGKGLAIAIANPFAAAAVPVILAATPSGASVGQQVVISGQGFTGTVATTGVKFNAVNATSWVVLSDTTIVAIMPAGSAGVGNIVVTNAAGASASFPYTRGA